MSLHTPFLFTFFLHLFIFPITSATETIANNPQPDDSIFTEDPSPLFSILQDLLKSSSFYGDWESLDSRPPLEFENTGGFIHLSFPPAAYSNGWYKGQFLLYLYDGPYIDQKSARLSLTKHHPTPTVDIANSTLVFTKVSTAILRSDSHSIQCDLDVTVHFLDLRNGQPLSVSLPSDTDDLGIQVLITSDTCNFNLSTYVLTSTDPVVESGIALYVIAQYVFACMEGLAYFALYKKLKRKQAFVIDVSLGTLYFFTAHDVYLFLNQMYVSASLPSLTTSQGPRLTIPLFQFIGIIYCMIVIFGNLPFLLELRMKTMQLQWKDVSEKIINISKIALIFNFLAFVLAFEAVILQLRILFYLMFALFPLPQIVQTFILGKKFVWNPFYFGALVIPKVCYFIYVQAYSLNIFRNTPSKSICYVILAIIAIQFLVLLVQAKWPTLWVKNTQGYKISKIQQDNRQNCPICLQDFYIEETKTSSETPLLDNSFSSEYTVITPCNHEFHLSCLKSWLNHKFECPYCRQPLPLLYQLEDIVTTDPELVL